MPLVILEPGEAESSFGQRALIIILVKWTFSKFFKGAILYSKIAGLSEYISSKLVLNEKNKIVNVIKGKQKGNGEKIHLVH